MNKNQKTYLRNWTLRKHYTFKRGGKISLQTIIDKVCKYACCSGLAMPEYMNDVHPFLYFNFVCDWSKIEDSHVPVGFNDGLEFGRSVIKDWQRECWEQKYFNYDLLSNYDNMTQLREAYETVLGDNIAYPEGFHALEERLYMIRQEFLDKAEAEHQAEQERLEQERQLRLAEDREIEARKAADELRRKQKAYEADTIARQNRQAHATYTAQNDTSAPASPSTPVSGSSPSGSSPKSSPDKTPTFADIMPDKLKNNPACLTLEDQVVRLQAEWSAFAGKEAGVCMGYDTQRAKFHLFVTCGDDETIDFYCASFSAAVDAAFDRLHQLIQQREDQARKAEQKSKLQQQLESIRSAYQSQMEALQKQIDAL